MGIVVAKFSELTEGSSRMVEVQDRKVALFRIGSKVYAIGGICPHRGAPLNEGSLDGTCLTCPWHAWEFDIASGDCKTVPQARVKSYPVRLKGDEIALEINPDDL